MPLITSTEWEEYYAGFPDAHLLQHRAWGGLKAAYGWVSRYVREKNCGAQVLFKKLPFGFTVAYIPKGPLGDHWRSLWPEIDRVCKQEKAIFLKVDPDQWMGESNLTDTDMHGFIETTNPIQPRRTIVVDLSGTEEEWLNRMKQKTRYNIRLAQKKDIRIIQTDQVNSFYRLMTSTGSRDGFGVHSLSYYQRAYDLFTPSGQCALLLATYQDRVLAGLMVFRQGSRAWYLYGASSDEERNRMPAYLLQWEAMRWAAQHGCKFYDLWGIPDEDEDRLEAEFMNRSDGLWKVYRFKRGFGGVVMRAAPSWDRVYQPILYNAYQLWTRARSGDSD